MIILGIDPALCSLGWAVIHEESSKLKYIGSGRIKTTNLDLMHKRLGYITREIEEIITHYQPNMIAMEITFVNTNAESSLKLGYVRGAIMALVGVKNLDYMEFRPNLIKKTVVGIGHADKSQVIHMIKLLIPGSSNIKNSDEADALAIAYTGVIYSKSVLYRAQQL